MSFVPSPRLIWLSGLLALGAGLAGLLPHRFPGWHVLLVLAMLAALADLFLGLRRPALPELALPELARFAKDRLGSLTLSLTGEERPRRRVRLGLALPGALGATETERIVDLGGSGQRHLEWPCLPRARGRFRGASACVEADSPWGLWQIRRRAIFQSEFRVYPNLLGEGREAAALFLPRAAAGTHAERTVGRGREFEKLREYLPGDGYDEIHWKASAKRSRPVTKVFQEERMQEIYVLVDASRLSARPVRRGDLRETALERSLTAALSLLAAAERQGDRFGLVAFDERVRAFLPAGAGPGHYAACREATLALSSGETAPDLAEIVRFLRTRIRRRALLFFLTDLADPVLAEDFARQAPLLARQHLVLIGQLRAPEVAALFSGDPVADDAEVYGKLAGHIRWTEMRAVARRLRPAGVTVAMLENETMAADVVRRYLAIKRRQIL